MKKLLSVLMALVLAAALCACAKAPAAPHAEETAPQPAVSEPAPAPDAVDAEESVDADELNEFGLPDLSGFTAEEIWDMYVHPENWDRETLELCDSDFYEPEEEPYADSEIDPDYVFDLGEWHDYDPGDWEPRPDEILDPGSGETPNAAGAETGAPAAGELPEQYAFLLPEGLKSGDTAMEQDGVFLVNLPGRDDADFDDVVRRLKEAGYTKNAQSMDMMGMKLFEASNGSGNVTVMLQNGTLMISFE